MEPAGISTTSTTFAMSSNANLRIDLQRDANDITLVITGVGLQKSLSHTKILDIAKLSGEPIAVKLTSINFAVEKRTGSPFMVGRRGEGYPNLSRY